MVPTNQILNSMQTSLASDTANLGAAAVKKVHLIMANFTPASTTDFTTLSEANFAGATALQAPAGAQDTYRDPTTGELRVRLLPPAGGWHWQASAGTNLPQTIYGYVVTDTASAVTYGSQLLDAPVTLVATGDGLDIGDVEFSFIPPVLE